MNYSLLRSTANNNDAREDSSLCSVVRHFCAKQRRTRHARSSRQCDCMSLHTARTLAESKRMSTLNQLLLHVHATDACLPACPGRRLNPSANYARSTTESFKRALERALKQETASRRHICRAGCANNSTRTTRAALARAQTRDWPALAGTGTFRIPPLFSGLRRFVYLMWKGGGRLAELIQPPVSL